jgi:hypothetical protein
VSALTESVDHIKTELMPEFDFTEFDREYSEEKSDSEGDNLSWN